MNETQTWLLQQAKNWEDSATDYRQRAFYHELQAMIQEQAQRLELAEGEIDGRTWNHEAW